MSYYVLLCPVMSCYVLFLSFLNLSQIDRRVFCYFNLSRSVINFLSSIMSQGDFLFLTLRDLIGACLFAIVVNIFCQTSIISSGVLQLFRLSQGVAFKSFLNASAPHFLNARVVIYLCVFFDGIENLRTAYTKLWSLIPICKTPDVRILEGSFDSITSMSVLEFWVILVGSLISCVSW